MTNPISPKNQVIVPIAGGMEHEIPSWLCVRHFAFHFGKHATQNLIGLWPRQPNNRLHSPTPNNKDFYVNEFSDLMLMTPPTHYF